MQTVFIIILNLTTVQKSYLNQVRKVIADGHRDGRYELTNYQLKYLSSDNLDYMTVSVINSAEVENSHQFLTDNLQDLGVDVPAPKERSPSYSAQALPAAPKTFAPATAA